MMRFIREEEEIPFGELSIGDTFSRHYINYIKICTSDIERYDKGRAARLDTGKVYGFEPCERVIKTDIEARVTKVNPKISQETRDKTEEYSRQKG
jgi:hypothetical protein